MHIPSNVFFDYLDYKKRRLLFLATFLPFSRLIIFLKAQDYADKATTDINDPKYAEAQAVVKKFYEEAKPFYEKARALKPDQQDLWLQGLYRVYYNLNMGPEFEEIDKLMK